MFLLFQQLLKGVARNASCFPKDSMYFAENTEEVICEKNTGYCESSVAQRQRNYQWRFHNVQI